MYYQAGSPEFLRQEFSGHGTQRPVQIVCVRACVHASVWVKRREREHVRDHVMQPPKEKEKSADSQKSALLPLHTVNVLRSCILRISSENFANSTLPPPTIL